MGSTQEGHTISVSGAQALREAEKFIKDFCVLPSPSFAGLLAVWAAHTHAYEAFDFTPRLAILSMKPASGKSRVLRTTGLLCARPKTMTNFTDALLARMAGKRQTLLLDETDTIFRTSQSAPKMQAVINDGFQAEGTNDKCAGSTEVVETSIFCPMALAGLRDFPPAVMTRSIVIRMEARRPEQRIGQFYSRLHVPLGKAIGDALGSWVKANAGELGEAWPDLPDDMEDREADCWSALFAVADVAGEEWPRKIREACQEIRHGIAAEPQESPLVRLLRDIQRVWTGERLSSSTLCGRLLALPDAPWVSRWPDIAAPRELATMLRGADITPRKMRIDGDRPVQGYDKADFVSVWASLKLVEQPEHSSS